MALIDDLLIHLSKTVKKDVVIQKTIQLVAVSAYTDNPLNLFEKGPTSVGKSYITVNSLRYWPKEDVLMLGGLSPKSLIHDTSFGRLEDAQGNLILEGFDEEGKPYLYYADTSERVHKSKYKEMRKIIDLKCKILVFLEAPQYETYMMLRPILSHDTKEITYKFVDKTGRGSMKTITVILRNWPATIFCTTDSKFLAELISRSITVSPAEDVDKYKAANQLTGENMAFPEDANDPELDNLQDKVNKICGYLRRNSIVPKCPAAAYRYPDLPHQIPDDMRHYKQFFSLIQNSALLNVEVRPVIRFQSSKIEKMDYVITTKPDYDLFAEFYNEFGESTRTGISKKALDLYNRVICATNEPLSAKEISEKAKDLGFNRTAKQIRDYELRILENAHFIEPQSNPDDKRQVLYVGTGSFDFNGNKGENIRLSETLVSSIPFSQTEAENWLERFDDKMRMINNTKFQKVIEPVYQIGINSHVIDAAEFIKNIVNTNDDLSHISNSKETNSNGQKEVEDIRLSETLVLSSNSEQKKEITWRCPAGGHGPYQNVEIIKQHQKECPDYKDWLANKRG